MVQDSAPLTVTIVDSTEGFQDLRLEWQRLLEKSHSNCVFLTWEWLFTWWKWYRADGKLLILLLRDTSGHLRGIGPLMSRRIMGVFHKLQLIGSKSKVCSDYLDIIAENGWEEQVARSIMRFLLKRYPRWHVLILSSIRRDSPLLTALLNLPEVGCLKSHKERQSLAPFISFPRTWDKLLAGFGPRIRRNIRYYRRKLEKDFHVELVPWSALFNRTQTINRMKTLQRKSISRKGLWGIFEDQTYRDFHAEIIDLFHKQGWLYIVFLLCDREPVAFWYAYLYGNRCYSYQTGFDTDYSSYSVGAVVHSYALQDTINMGIGTFEYLRGGQEYKHHFANSVKEMLQVFIYSNAWCSLWLVLLLTCTRRIKSYTRRLFGKNLSQRIKAKIFRLPKLLVV